jgi:hypothetical protein
MPRQCSNRGFQQDQLSLNEGCQQTPELDRFVGNTPPRLILLGITTPDPQSKAATSVLGSLTCVPNHLEFEW